MSFYHPGSRLVAIHPAAPGWHAIVAEPDPDNIVIENDSEHQAGKVARHRLIAWAVLEQDDGTTWMTGIIAPPDDDASPSLASDYEMLGYDYRTDLDEDGHEWDYNPGRWRQEALYRFVGHPR